MRAVQSRSARPSVSASYKTEICQPFCPLYTPHHPTIRPSPRPLSDSLVASEALEMLEMSFMASSSEFRR